MAAVTKSPILIVGAGATGLTLANVLARHGTSFRIIDKLAEVNPLARTVGVQSRTLEVFQDLGVVDRIVDMAAKMVADCGLNSLAERF